MKPMIAVVLTSVLWMARPAVADSVLSFDGVNDRVMVPYDSSFPTETFTLSAWIQLGPPGHRSAIIARGEDDNSWNLSWQLYVNPDGTLQIMLENANENNACYPFECFGALSPLCVAGELQIADDLWHHVAATRDAASGILILYVDGEPQAACGQTIIPSSNNNQFLTIGCTHGFIGPPPGGVEPPVWFFPGLIDEPAMWNIALSPAEIQEVFDNGVDPDSAGLVGYWDFEEGTGQVTVDQSPAGNDGFLGANSGGDPADPLWVIEGCFADLEGDGIVDETDLFIAILIVLQEFGPCEGDCPLDFDGNGVVDETDLYIVIVWVLQNFGPCPQ